jgi:SPX domain protein involved in polyphosphate accumulation
MKFGKLIQKLAIPEWRACYINYHLLKALLYVLIAVGDAAANQVPDE